MKEEGNTLVNSIIKAFNVLEILAFEDYERKGTSLSELSKRLDIKTNTLHNILKTMAFCGFVAQNENSHYMIGSKGLQIGVLNKVFAIDGLTGKLRPVMQELSRQIEESVILYILINGNRVPVVQVENNGVIKVDIESLMQHNLFEKPTGRILTAYANKQELEQIIKRWGMPGEHWDGIDNENSLMQELENVRKKGSSELSSEKDGLVSFAVPILYQSGEMFGSLGCYVPGYKCSQEKRKIIIEEIDNTAKKIEKML